MTSNTFLIRPFLCGLFVTKQDAQSGRTWCYSSSFNTNKLNRIIMLNYFIQMIKNYY